MRKDERVVDDGFPQLRQLMSYWDSSGTFNRIIPKEILKAIPHRGDPPTDAIINLKAHRHKLDISFSHKCL
jgi:hypothetical protein